MTEVTPQTAIFLVIGCLILLTLFFMMVAGAAIFVARLSGRSFMGPIMGMGLRMLSVKSEADAEDSEANITPLPAHRHIDAAQVKAESEERLDFERTVEQYRGQAVQQPPQQNGGYAVEAEAVGAPLPQQPYIAPVPQPVVSTVPVTPIAPPIPVAPEGVPATPIMPPTAEPTLPLESNGLPYPPYVPPQTPQADVPFPNVTPQMPPPPTLPPLPESFGNQIPSANDYAELPPRPPTLPDEDEHIPPIPPTLPPA